MARYIDADKLIKHLEETVEDCGNPNVKTQPVSYGTVLGLKGALSYARTLSAVAVAEVEKLRIDNKILSKNADEAFQQGLNENQALFEKTFIKDFAEKLKEEQEFFINECEQFVGFVAVSRIDELVEEKMSKDVLPKRVPLKPEYEADGYDENGNLVYDTAYCPKCRRSFEYDINDWGCNYCQDCGQALDWSNVDESPLDKAVEFIPRDSKEIKNKANANSQSKNSSPQRNYFAPNLNQQKKYSR